LKSVDNGNSQCLLYNGNCSHICTTNDYQEVVCKCPKGMKINSDQQTCQFVNGYCSRNKPCVSSTCIDYYDHYECQCKNQTYGLNCQFGHCLGTNPCENGGDCVESKNGGYTCNCLDDYYGINCNRSRFDDPCYQSLCSQSSSCVPSEDTYICQCEDARYFGEYCQHIDHCKSLPCQNKALCILNNTVDFTCICSPLHIGRTCEKLHPCSKLPCLNDGVCQFDGDNFKCLCAGFYIGSKCQSYYGEDIVQATFKIGNSVKVTRDDVITTLVEVYNTYCVDATDCGLVYNSTLIRKRREVSLEFTAKDIILVSYGEVSESGILEVKYAVIVPSTSGEPSKFIPYNTLSKGLSLSGSVVKQNLNAQVTSISRYNAPTTSTDDTSNNRMIIYIVAIGGGVLVLTVFIVTVGCCVVKRRQAAAENNGLSYRRNIKTSAQIDNSNPYVRNNNIQDIPLPSIPDTFYEDLNKAKYDSYYLESVTSPVPSISSTKPMVGNDNIYEGLDKTQQLHQESNYVSPNNHLNDDEFIASEREKSRQISGNYTGIDNDYITFNGNEEQNTYAGLNTYKISNSRL